MRYGAIRRAVLIVMLSCASGCGAETETNHCSGVKYDEANVDACNRDLENPKLSVRDRYMLYNMRGNTLSMLGRHEKAIEDYNRVIGLAPEFDYGFANRGVEFIYLKDFQSAVRDLDRALQLAPENSYARYARGIARVRLGDLIGGKEDLEAGRDSKATFDSIGLEP